MFHKKCELRRERLLLASFYALWNSMLKRFGSSRDLAEKAALEEPLETAAQATTGRRDLRRGLVAAIAALAFASGFALGSYSDLLKQAAADLRTLLGWGGAVSDVDAGNAAYGKGDYATALRLLRPLADQDDARAQSTIGEMYYHGRGVPQDDSEAIRWFRLAAGQGNAPARFHLGVAYAGGHGVPQDYSEAAKWYRLAADQGYAPAMYNLGLAYAKGEGVSLDNVSAHMWFNLAASSFPASDSRGHSVAIKNRDLVASKMIPEEIEEAQKLAREWVVQ